MIYRKDTYVCYIRLCLVSHAIAFSKHIRTTELSIEATQSSLSDIVSPILAIHLS